MKKRKSPIVLVTLLAVMASVSFGLQYAWSKSAGPGTEQPQTPPTDISPVGQPRAPESKESVSDNIKRAVGGSGGAPSEGPPRGPMGPGGPGGPMILNPSAQAPNAKPEKPKPNPTATSTQWYLNK